jgi:OFA family oxalate/formate antiporter-like MFS transporter
MLRTPNFYALWVAYCLGTTAGLMTISQLVPFARSAGLTAAAATFAITVGAVGNAGGRILSGWLSDTLGRLTTLRVMVLVSAVAMPALFIWRQYLGLFYLLVVAVYWCYGTQLSVFASTTADMYGTRYLGANYGLLFTAWGTAGILGPAIGARVYDATGEYQYAFYAAHLRVAPFRCLPSAVQEPKVCGSGDHVVQKHVRTQGRRYAESNFFMQARLGRPLTVFSEGLSLRSRRPLRLT